MTEPLAASAPPERRSGPLHDLAAVDEAVYRAVAGLDTPSLDRGLRLLTTAANGSALWLGIAGAMVAFGGQRGRRATVRGLASIAITSAAVNQGLKRLHRRSRPDRGEWAAGRHVPMPGSSSFPSGHSASGFAFASAVSVEYPLLALPLRGLAAAVAYSRGPHRRALPRRRDRRCSGGRGRRAVCCPCAGPPSPPAARCARPPVRGLNRCATTGYLPSEHASA